MSVKKTKIGMTLYELNAHRVQAQRAGVAKCYKMEEAIDRFVNLMKVDEVNHITHSLAKGWSVRFHEELSAHTYKNDLVLLRKLFGHGLRLGVVDENPFWEVRGMESENITVSPSLLGRSPVHEVLDRIRCKIWLEPAWFWRYVLWFRRLTGANSAQMVRLCWGDIDFERKALRLCGDDLQGDEGWIPLALAVEGLLLQLRESILEAGWLDLAEQVFNISRHSDVFGSKGLTREQLDRFLCEFDQRHSEPVCPETRGVDRYCGQ